MHALPIAVKDSVNTADYPTSQGTGALRDFRPVQSLFNPANAAFLTTSNLFNPQSYAIRRLVTFHGGD